MDRVTENRIALLHPKVRNEVTTIVNEANSLLTKHSEIRIVQGLRTIQEQNALYAQGRTAPGKIVTNAKGGSSFHNYGLAVDFCLLINGSTISWSLTADYDNDQKADWQEVVEVFKRYGWEWGGNWTSIKDYPHFQKTFGYTWRQLLAKYNSGDFLPGTQYVNI